MPFAHYKTPTPTAHPPTCRRGHCSLPAVDGDWCAEHAAEIEARRAIGAHQLAHLKRAYRRHLPGE